MSVFNFSLCNHINLSYDCTDDDGEVILAAGFEEPELIANEVPGGTEVMVCLTTLLAPPQDITFSVSYVPQQSTATGKAKL